MSLLSIVSLISFPKASYVSCLLFAIPLICLLLSMSGNMLIPQKCHSLKGARNSALGSEGSWGPILTLSKTVSAVLKSMNFDSSNLDLNLSFVILCNLGKVTLPF